MQYLQIDFYAWSPLYNTNIMLYEKNDFAEISKNLGKSKNNLSFWSSKEFCRKFMHDKQCCKKFWHSSNQFVSYIFR